MDFSRVVPPNDIPAEMSLLGSLLLNYKCWGSICDIVSKTDFYREANATIYSAMQDVVEAGDELDIVSLMTALTDRNALEQVGGLAYLMQVGDFVPSTSHVATYAKLVKKASDRRRMMEQCFHLVSNINEDIETQDLYDQWIGNVGSVSGHADDSPHVDEYVGPEVEQILNRSTNAMAGLTTGFMNIDEAINGFRPGELIILGARPSMGKSALALQMALGAARKGHTCLYASIEMSSQMVSQRILSLMTGIDNKRLANTMMYDHEKDTLRKARATLMGYPGMVCAKSPLTIGELRSRATRLKKDKALAIVFIDYLQMVDAGSKSDNRTREIGIISRSLKSMAKELNVAVVALSSLSRSVERRDDKRPMMSDLRESGDIESDADVVMFLYRALYYADMTTRADIQTEDAEVIVSKNRNGSVGGTVLSFTPRLAKFEDTAYGGL
jgi:replicative DNA helicase